MSRLTWQLDDLRIAVGEVEALAALLLESFNHANWTGVADKILVERMGYVLGILAASATATVSKLKRLQATIGAAQPTTSGYPVERSEQHERSPISITLASVEQLLRVGAAYLDDGRTQQPVDPASTRSEPAVAVRATKLSPDAEGPHPEPKKPQERWRVIANEDERHAISNKLHAHEMKVLWTLRNRCAEAFGESPYHPFFQESYLPGEDPSAALLRMFKQLQFSVGLNDEETIAVLVRRSHR